MADESSRMHLHAEEDPSEKRTLSIKQPMALRLPPRIRLPTSTASPTMHDKKAMHARPRLSPSGRPGASTVLGVAGPPSNSLTPCPPSLR